MVERYIPPKTIDPSSKEAQNQINKTKPRDFYFAFLPNKGFTLKCTQMPLSDLIKNYFRHIRLYQYNN